MKTYKSKMCTSCINKNCSNNIVKIQKGDTTVTKCNDYMKSKKDNKEFLDKYVNKLKMRKFRNDY